MRPTRNSSGVLQDASLLAVVEDGVLLGEDVIGQTDLVAVDAAPGQELTALGAGEGVVLAAVNVGDLVVAQGLDVAGSHLGGIVLASVVLYAKLGVVVEAPAEDAALLVDDEAVVRAAGDADGLGAADGHGADALGLERRLGVVVEDLAAELVLLAAAPGVDLALVVECENVVGAGGDLRDAADVVDEDGDLLDIDGGVESEEAIAVLYRHEELATGCFLC